MSYPAKVQRGITLALEAHRRGNLDDAALSRVFAFYDGEGALDPPEPEVVLQRLGGLTTDVIAAVAGVGAPAPASPPQGQRFTDRLDLLDLLGEGGMGAVHRAHDRVLRRVVAVKLIRADRLDPASAPRILARFEREARAMARVRHPACVPIFDAGVADGGRPYLVMGFVEGQSLRQRLASGPLEPLEAARLGQAVAEGLQACHDAGVVHRDVKPANILIDAAGKPHLTDFGVAIDDHAHTKLTAAEAAIGTLAYMPPEQALGKPVDGRADVYALGATLHEALTGEPPFDGPGLVMLRQIVEADPPPLTRLRPEVPADLATIVLTCLAKEPQDRYAMAGALALDLARLLAGEPILARRQGHGDRLLRAVRVHGRRVGLAILLLLLASAATLAARRIARERRLAEIARLADSDEPDLADRELTARTDPADPAVSSAVEDARRRVRGRRLLLEAHAVLRQAADLIREAERCDEVGRGLREALDPTEVFARSPTKKRLAQVLSRAAVARQDGTTALLTAERVAAQAAVLAPGAEADRLRGEVLSARAVALEELDPAEAERLASAALALDPTNAWVAPPHLTIESSPLAQATIGRFEADPETGAMAIASIATITATPWSLQVPAGDLLVELSAPGHLPLRLALRMRRGYPRRCAVALVPVHRLGPLHDVVVPLPAGVARYYDGIQASTAVSPIVMHRTEVALSEWVSFLLAGAERIDGTRWQKEPRILAASRRHRFGASGVRRLEVDRYLEWLEAELALAIGGRAWVCRLPRSEEFFWAVRGEFAWPFPWGHTADETLASLSLGAERPELGEVPTDVSPFGVVGQGGGLREMVLQPTKQGRLARAELQWLAGGDVGASIIDARALLIGCGFIPYGQTDSSIGFRYVLEPVETPTRTEPRPPDPRLVDKARQAASQGRLLQAQQLLTEALRTGTADPDVWVQRANIRFMREDLWGAIWDSTCALMRDPKSTVALCCRGFAHITQETFAQAKPDFEQAVALKPELAQAWDGLGWAKLGLGDVAGAIPDLERAVALAQIQGIGQIEEAAGRRLAEARRRLAQAATEPPGTQPPGSPPR